MLYTLYILFLYSHIKRKNICTCRNNVTICNYENAFIAQQRKLKLNRRGKIIFENPQFSYK